ncbi:MAG TPA: alpha/beta fold hydrolase [Anaerolineales bacterium]|nr:alpha/beta fold hydrolase [Anaerolineales bacterium]
MRTFETLLIAVNLFSLVLSLRKQSKAAWLGMAGANLSVFLIHGLLEGFRYQMAFSYMLVFLFTFSALVKTNSKVKSGTPKALKVMAVSLSLVLLAFTSLLAVALPVFALPEPTGSYDVGIQYFHLVDENRIDPFLDTSAQKRELMVKVYYPAKEDDSKSFSSYFHNSPELINSFVAFYGMPDFAFNHLNLVKTNSKDHLQLSDQQPSYPVILFSHGAGTTMEVQTSQSEDLASHGYIVVNIDHTYVSAATAFPDRIVSHHEATTNFNTPEPAEIITQIMADDSSFVIDRLIEMNEGKIESIFKGKLDLEKIGAVGHSVGGAVAYNLAINDPRVKATVNLDGVVFLTPPENFTDIAPFLMLANDKYHIQAIQSLAPLMKRFEDMDDVEQKITIEIYGSEEAYHEAYSKAQQNVIGLTEVLKSSGNLFTIAGSDHMKFTDIGLFIGIRPLRELIGIGGTMDPARCLEITKAVTLAFFDQHLKGEANDSLESLTQKYPELINVDLK